MAKRAQGLSQQIAADGAGVSVRSAQRIDRGDHQPDNQPHCGRSWRTRADPLADVWQSVLVPRQRSGQRRYSRVGATHAEPAHRRAVMA